MSMSRHHARALALSLLTLPSVSLAQSMDMADMPGMSTPSSAAQTDPHANHVSPPPSASSNDTHAHDDAAPMDHTMHAAAIATDSDLPPNDHVAPPPPQSTPQAMSHAQMIDLMQMDDAATRGMWLFDRLERSRSTDGDYATSWEAEGWWGSDLNRLWVKTEGERGSDRTQDGRVEALWSHAWTSFWDGQLGARQDFGQGPNRQWAAVGVQGLAPYWFETQATFYLGEQGRTAARFEASYEMRFTQRLILEPKLELNIYGKDDPQRGISSGLSDLEAGLRLRYEFSRKFAPYIGVNWARRFGGHSDVPGAIDLPARETTWVAGVRLWF
jgi:copper resistance protein B